jgi:hypothetical protein
MPFAAVTGRLDRRRTTMSEHAARRLPVIDQDGDRVEIVS